MKSRFAIVLLLQIVLVVSTHTSYFKSEERVQSRTKCSGADNVCKNCQTLLDCGTSSEIDCVACQLTCGEGPGSPAVAGCYAHFDSDGIDDGSGNPFEPTNNICHCKNTDGSNLSDKSYADPYDSSYYIECVDGNPTYQSCGDGQIFYDISQSCGEGEDCGANTDKVEDPLNCNSYIDCTPPGIGNSVDCPQSSDIFDDSLSPPDCVKVTGTECTGTTSGTLTQHYDVCYIGVLCVGSPQSLTYSECCPRGKYFDSTTNQCEDDNPAASVCSENAPDWPSLCIQEYWEQELCNSCTEVGSFYGTREHCSRYFYECVNDGNDNPIPQLAQCPDTYPIFDVLNNQCNLAANIAGC